MTTTPSQRSTHSKLSKYSRAIIKPKRSERCDVIHVRRGKKLNAKLFAQRKKPRTIRAYYHLRMNYLKKAADTKVTRSRHIKTKNEKWQTGEAMGGWGGGMGRMVKHQNGNVEATRKYKKRRRKRRTEKPQTAHHRQTKHTTSNKMCGNDDSAVNDRTGNMVIARMALLYILFKLLGFYCPLRLDECELCVRWNVTLSRCVRGCGCVCVYSMTPIRMTKLN